jgi:hypothetical protein
MIRFFRKTLILFLLAIALLPALIPRPKPLQNKEGIAKLPFNPAWEGRPLTADEQREAAIALSQPYRYLGGGGQCFSFVSKDDKYVVKFIKQKPFDLPAWMRRFPLPFLIQRKWEKRAAKRDRAFQAFKLSFDLLSSETGLIYVHLNRTVHLHRALPFEDAEGKTHWIALDDVPFVVQKRAELASQTIDRLMQDKDLRNAKLAIDRILALNLKLSQKGFHNRDPNFRSNCGFIGADAILIDVGRIASGKQESCKAICKFRDYLLTKHPELLQHFDQSVAE